MNKWKAKEIFKSTGIKTPYAKLVYGNKNISDQTLEIFKTFTLPVIIKPVDSGSSIGTNIGRDLGSIEKALISALNHSPIAVVEEFIRGKEATCAVAEGFRGQKHYAFPPIEIVKHKDVAFDKSMKDSGDIEKICPGNFTTAEKEAIMNIAKLAHVALGARHYSCSDFIVHPTRGIYILEINTLPGFTEKSLFPKALQAVGSNIKEFMQKDEDASPRFACLDERRGDGFEF
jgi:D-alanine-D-alanine ligase